jgi:hypothetical protein
MEFDLGVRAGHLLTMKGGRGEVLEDQFIGIKGNLIAEISPFKSSHAATAVKMVDASE